MPGWQHDTSVQPDGTVHVWPDDDAFDHDLTRACLCGPALEEHTTGRVLVTHHSLDGREQSER